MLSHPLLVNVRPWCRYTVFVLDKLHRWNHSACTAAFRIQSTYNNTSLIIADWVNKINTQACEQWNSQFDVKAASMQQSGQQSVMREVRLAARRRNLRTNERLLKVALAQTGSPLPGP